MIVSIHQPAYLPWLGYLARIAASDVFVFFDTVQFEKNSFTNRNRIKTANGPIWLTVPVLQQGHMEKKLCEIEIDPRQDWRKKHLRSIEMSYRKAPRFDACFPRLQALYAEDAPLLADLCYRQLRFWLDELGITTRVVRASELDVTGQKSDLVLAICRHLGASHYISGPLGRGYLHEADFAAAGIGLSYQEFTHPVYPQLYGEFTPAMGVVDYWLNSGDSRIFC
ncbi:MAG TPA: WbqC family protein [Rhodocyclaceae bacterium]